MTDSTHSTRKTEVIEDEKQLAQKTSHPTTEDVLHATQSESAKVSSSKLLNHPDPVTGKISSKNVKQDSSDVLNDSIKDNLTENVDSILKCPLPTNIDVKNSQAPTPNDVSKKISSDGRLPIANNLANVVPDCMLTVLQQKAQNVLKMIALDSELKVPEGPHPKEESNLNEISTTNATDTSSDQSALRKSNESTTLKSSRSSNQESAIKESVPSKEPSVEDKVCSTTVCKTDESRKASNVALESPKSELSSEKSNSNLEVKKETTVQNSESEQSSRSTEQYTTNYETKNNVVANVKISNERLKNEAPNYFKVNAPPTTGILVQQCAPNGENITINAEMINDLNLTPPNQSASDVIKELSQAINSNEVPVKLSKQGDLISQMFKQKFLTKLQDTGNLDENTAHLANVTAMKFAKWMDDILNDIDTRSKSNLSPEKKLSKKGVKETKENEEYVSATSSKESLSKEEGNVESLDVVKIKEISESDLLDQYGTHLLHDSSYQLFQFVGPDSIPIEVRHLTTVESKKVMIVKKKTTDTQWSNWVVEVGPDISLESVSGSVLQKIEKEDTEKIVKEKQGWNLKKKLGYDSWMPNIFKTKIVKHKIPILKKQCVMTDSDHEIAYPPYPVYDTLYEKLFKRDTIRTNTKVNNETDVTHEAEKSKL